MQLYKQQCSYINVLFFLLERLIEILIWYHGSVLNIFLSIPRTQNWDIGCLFWLRAVESHKNCDTALQNIPFPHSNIHIHQQHVLSPWKAHLQFWEAQLTTLVIYLDIKERGSVSYCLLHISLPLQPCQLHTRPAQPSAVLSRPSPLLEDALCLCCLGELGWFTGDLLGRN